MVYIDADTVPAGPKEIGDYRVLMDITADELLVGHHIGWDINGVNRKIRLLQHRMDGRGIPKLLNIMQSPAFCGHATCVGSLASALRN
jgi:hypothetical protein